MKKIFLLISAIWIVSTIVAQSEYPFLREKYYYGIYPYPLTKEKIKNNKIKEVEIIWLLRKDHKKKKQSTRKFDSSGNCIEIDDYEKNGKLSSQIKIIRNGEKKIPNKIILNGEGKELEKHIYVYDTLLTEESIYRKGKFFSKITYKYDSVYLLESVYYKKDENKFNKKWVYEYYPNHQKKSSTLYDKNGKIKYVWNYECKEEGELEGRHSDTTRICKKEEIDKDGNETITYRNFNEKGEIYKEVYVYDRDKRLIGISRYNIKDSIYYKYTYIPDKYTSIESNYNKKGVERIRREYVYDKDQNTIEESFISKNNKHCWKYEYDEKGLLISTKHYYAKKGELNFSEPPGSEIKYNYSFF